jgi:hypothetical protein
MPSGSACRGRLSHRYPRKCMYNDERERERERERKRERERERDWRRD